MITALRLSKSAARATGAAAGQALEPLERRTLLSQTPFSIDRWEKFTPASADLRDFRAGPLANLGSLAPLYLEFRSFKSRHPGKAFRPGDAYRSLLFKGEKVGVSVRTTSNPENVASRFRRGGFELTTANGRYGVLEGFMPVTLLRELGQRADVISVQPLFRPQTRSVGLANNQGDEALRADLARQNLGMTGAGVKIGIISDSINQLGAGVFDGIRSGDLPFAGVNVLEDGTVSPEDEGRAMAELIHDIAPDAELLFHTALPSQLAMAEGIDRLAAAGADIIVDDIGFADEPLFAPGVIDVAIRDFVQAGGIYLSAAGNSGFSGYQIEASFVEASDGRMLLDFDPADDAVDTRMAMSGVTLFGTMVLQWSDPYNGVVGLATSDLSLAFYVPGTDQLITVVDQANLITGAPLETFSAIGDAFDIEIELVETAEGATPPRFVRMHSFASGIIYEHTATPSTTAGHGSGPFTISVGAVPFFNAPPVIPDTDPILPEDFSSSGPVTRVYDFDGNLLPEPVTENKPDIAGIDGVNTSFFPVDEFGNPQDIDADDDFLPNFFGTSAAAPNVAAVVALMLQANPNATQAEVLEVLKQTARPVNGLAQGVWDPQGGFGLVDALAAVRFYADTFRLTEIDVGPATRYSPLGSAVIRFSQQIASFDAADQGATAEFVLNDVTLTRDGTPVTLDPLSVLLSSVDGISWTLSGLAPIATDAGVYVLTVLRNDITSAIGQLLPEGGSATFTVLPPPARPDAPADLLVEAVASDTLRVSFSPSAATEVTRYTIQRADDAAFTQNLKTYHLPPGETSLLNAILDNGRRFFYRVRADIIADDFILHSAWSAGVAGITVLRGEKIVDNASPSGVRIGGSWSVKSSVAGFLGADFLDDRNDGKGAKNVGFTPVLDAAGDYFVYTRYSAGPDRASNAPYEIGFGPGGQSRQTVLVDQRVNGGGWVLLGRFRFEKGGQGFVRITTTATDGVVVADAVRFLPADSSIFGGNGIDPGERLPPVAAAAPSVFSAASVARSIDLLDEEPSIVGV